LKSAKIWEVARATSAAASFFDPIKIGSHGTKFLDGGTGANNPIYEMWMLAKDEFCPEDQSGSLLGCQELPSQYCGVHTYILALSEFSSTSSITDNRHRRLCPHNCLYS
jgi:patatin-like phospholipase/acyl hydrolase